MPSWQNTFRNSPLPKGIRIRQSADGSLRLYVRLTDERGRQADIATPYIARNKSDIADAQAYYFRLRSEISQAKASVDKKPRPQGQVTIAEVMAMEYDHWMRPGKTRSVADVKAWETNARLIAQLLGGDTPVESLTNRTLHQFVVDRTTDNGAKKKATFSTAMRSLVVLRSAIRRAQDAGRVPDNWTVRWPTRDEFDRQGKDERLTANVIPRHYLAPFFEELAKEHLVGRDKTTYGQCIVYMFKLALHTGMRAGELEKLRVRDIEPHRMYIHGKRSAPAWFDLYGEHASKIAYRVIEIRGIANQPDALLFTPDTSAGELTYSHGQAARRASKKLGLPMIIKLRDMRASAGRREYDGDPAHGKPAKDIERAQVWLRHKSIEMTQKYLKVGKRIEQHVPDSLTDI